MMQKTRNLIYESFKGKYEGIGQAITGTLLYAGIMMSVISYTNHQTSIKEHKYYILKQTPERVQMFFPEDSLIGFDFNRDGKLDKLMEESICIRPPILSKRTIPKDSELFKKNAKIYEKGFKKNSHLK